MEIKDCVCAGSHMESAVFVASSEHPLARKGELLLDDVLDEAFIETGSNTFLQQQFNEQAARHGKVIHSYIQTESSTMIMKLVERNLGLAFLPEYLVRRTAKTRSVVILPVKDFSFSFYTHMFYHKNKWVTPQMSEMIRIVKDEWDDTKTREQ